MNPKFILSADDYGPIDFINRGVRYAVKNGLINSVQVLANGDRVHLREAMQALNESVPDGQSVDVGLHLTLTSGKPLFKAAGNSIDSTWGKMLKKGSFKKFSKFYFGYRDKFNAIDGEFKAQLEQLQDAMNLGATNKLKLTTLSHHHGIFAIDDVLFSEYYAAFGKANKLAIRNPKALPASSNNSFFGFVVPLLNLTDRKTDRKEMERMNDAFGRNEFAGKADLSLKTANYTEVSFYGSLGSLANINVMHEKRINKRVETFKEIIDRATKYTPKPDLEPKDKIVEVVFHIGDHQQGQGGFKQAVKNYKGVDHKYFEDRQHELHALERIGDAHKDIFGKQLVSWEACEEVTFKKLS